MHIAKNAEAQNSHELIVDKLKNAREQQGITQYELAKSAGVTQATISAIELKQKRPMLLTIIKIAKVLGEAILL